MEYPVKLEEITFEDKFTDSLPLVSVIVPSFNHRHFVGETINSILLQTYSRIQLIVIDDGSTDGSVELIAALAEQHSFEFIAQTNVGLIATLNRAKKLVRGKYVSLCASDDFYHLQKIERLVNFLESQPDYAMVHSKIILVDDESKEIKRIDERCSSGHVFGPLLRGDFYVNGLSALVRADVYSQFEYLPFYIEDWYMWLRIAERYSLGYVGEYLAYYRRHGSNMSGNVDKMMISEKSILDFFNHSPEYPIAILRWREKWFNYYATQLDPASRLKAFTLGFEILSHHHWSVRVLKGWVRWFWSSIRAIFTKYR
jgi:alpha-1,3-rhamnosyltransferase